MTIDYKELGWPSTLTLNVDNYSLSPFEKKVEDEDFVDKGLVYALDEDGNTHITIHHGSLGS
jgi:hypothetical protein